MSPRMHSLVGLSMMVGLATTGCGDDQDPEGAADLLDRLEADNYQSWASPAGWDTPQASNAPHGDPVVIYINDVVVDAIAGEPIDKWPVGSIIVKDGYDGDAIDVITAMEKRDDGWFWAEWDDEGESIYSGKPEVCTDCHSSGDDFVRAFNLP